MQEVEKMMKDPAFIKEMERIKQDPLFANAMQQAKDMYSDPAKAARMMSELSAQAAAATASKKSDVQLGMEEIARTAKNPKVSYKFPPTPPPPATVVALSYHC